MRYLLLFIFLFCLKASSSLAQVLSFKNWNLENGLPSNEAYRTLQDQEGFIWICTDHGVVRYDGQSFEDFSTLNGLTDNTVFRIYQDCKNRLWFLSMSGGLCYWNGKTIVQHIANAQLKALLGRLDRSLNMAVDSNDVIYFTQRGVFGYYSIGLQDSVIYFTPLSKDKHRSALLLVLDQQNSLLIRVPLIQNKKPWQGKLKKRKHPLVALPEMPNISRRYQDKNNLFFFSRDTLYQTNRNHTEVVNYWALPKNKVIQGAYIDKKEQLWVINDNQLLFYGQAPFYKQPKVFLQNAKVASIYEDTEGNYWIGTLDQGVFFVLNWQVFHFFENKVITKTLALNHKIFALNNHNLYHINATYPFQEKVYQVNRSIASSDFFDIGLWKNNIVLPNGKMLQINQDKIQLNRKNELKWKKEKNQLKWKSGKTIYVDEETGTFLIGRKNGLTFIDGIPNLELNNNYWINAIEHKSKDAWFLGTNKGLCFYNKPDHKWVDLGKKDSLLNQRILALCSFQKFLLAGTRGSGVLLVDNQSYKVVGQWDNLDAVASGFIRCITVENDSVLWIGTNKGANRLIVINGQVKQSVELNVKNYLPSNGVNHILVQDSIVWLATDKGLAHVPKNLLNKRVPKTPIPLYFNKINVNGKVVPIQEYYELEFNQQNIGIDFLALSFEASNSLTYRYQLIKKGATSEEWIYTKHPSIHFNKIIPSEYKLLIEVKKDGNWQTENLTLSFKIKPHFTQTWSFLFLVLGTVIGIIGIYIRNILMKKNLEKELAEAEQKSLRSQMKPHFLFNSLNSVIHFLYKNQKKQAIKFLQTFSTLMRQTLENTQHQVVRLERDLEHLQLYMDMERESLAYGSPYVHDFSIELSENLNVQEWEIPSMLVQPLVENAIIHGLSVKKGDRKLKVLLKEDKNHLIIEIVDNGIGRLAAKEMKKHFFVKRASHGLNILNQRIRTLNNLFKIKIKIEVEDIKSDPNSSTKFTLYFPATLKNKSNA